MPFSLEKITSSEVREFWPVFKEVLENDFPDYTPEVIRNFLEKHYTIANYEYYLDNNLKTIFVVRDSETHSSPIIAFAVIDEIYGGVSLLRWLGVRKEHQRKGIGKILIQKWEEEAISKKAHKMEVAAQAPAKDFYAKAGLTLEGHRRKSYFGIDQYIYGKVLL
jgi:ribosomal protein S18 acetylase RimI-like enzyme